MTTIKPISKVLFVSDEKDSKVAETLKNYKFQVFESNVDEVSEVLAQKKPDLILVNVDIKKEDGMKICNLVKEVKINPRPVTAFLIHEDKPDDRIEVLRSGADDAISFPIPEKEIAVRVLAHLRRREETHVNIISGLPDSIIASNVLQNCINEVEDWAVLSIDLDNLRIYNDAYGHSRGDQLIKALAAVLRSVLSDDEFLAHRHSDDFTLITKSNRAELLAEEICRRFDLIAPKFYSKEDAERGYVIAVGPSGVRRRVQLVSISIGITGANRRKFTNELEVIQVVRDMRYLAKGKNGSDWVSDRPRLSSREVPNLDKRVRILVVEPDASMSLLLRDTLEMEGYAVEITHEPKEAWEYIKEWRPELILMETEFSDEFDGWALSTKIKQEPELAGIWLVMTTKNPDPSKALDAGADLYFPKPYDLHNLFPEIRYLLRTRIRSKIVLN